MHYLAKALSGPEGARASGSLIEGQPLVPLAPVQLHYISAFVYPAGPAGADVCFAPVATKLLHSRISPLCATSGLCALQQKQ